MTQVGYTMTRHVLVLDNPERRYILKVRDLPDEDKPRERVLKNGPTALSVPELLAVILTTGTKKEEVLSMANRIIQEYGERSIMSQKDPNVLSSELNIPIGKATQIVAAAELGRRFYSKNDNGAPTIRTARDVFEYAQDMKSLSKEHLRGIYLNTHYKLIHDEVISIGTLDANIVHPRDVFRPALERAAAAVILVHNHPSGVVKPSGEDVRVTEQIIKAGMIIGIDVVDHVIVTRNSFMSIPAPYR